MSQVCDQRAWYWAQGLLLASLVPCYGHWLILYSGAQISTESPPWICWFFKLAGPLSIGLGCLLILSFGIPVWTLIVQPPWVVSRCWDTYVTTIVKSSSAVPVPFSCPVTRQVTSNESLQLRGLWRYLKVDFWIWVNLTSVISICFSINKSNINTYKTQFGLISTSSSSSPPKKEGWVSPEDGTSPLFSLDLANINWTLAASGTVRYFYLRWYQDWNYQGSTDAFWSSQVWLTVISHVINILLCSHRLMTA